MSRLNDLDCQQASIILSEGEEKQNCYYCVNNVVDKKRGFIYCSLSDWDNEPFFNHELLIQYWQNANDIPIVDYGYNCSKFKSVILDSCCPETGKELPRIFIIDWKWFTINGIPVIDEQAKKSFDEKYLNEFMKACKPIASVSNIFRKWNNDNE